MARFTQITGMLSTAGLVLIGCFQVDEAADIHFSGAVMCFILGGVYYILTTVITRYLKEKDAYFGQIYKYRLVQHVNYFYKYKGLLRNISKLT